MEYQLSILSYVYGTIVYELKLMKYIHINFAIPGFNLLNTVFYSWNFLATEIQ